MGTDAHLARRTLEDSRGGTMNESVAPVRGMPSRRTVLAGAAWSVPVIALAAAAPQAAASGKEFLLSNRDLALKPHGLKVHVGLNQLTDGGTVVDANVTVTLVRGSQSIPKNVVISVGWNGQQVVEFDDLEVGAEYYAYITVTAPGFQTISSVATDPASRTVTPWG